MANQSDALKATLQAAVIANKSDFQILDVDVNGHLTRVTWECGEVRRDSVFEGKAKQSPEFILESIASDAAPTVTSPDGSEVVHPILAAHLREKERAANAPPRRCGGCERDLENAVVVQADVLRAFLAGDYSVRPVLEAAVKTGVN